MPRKPLDHFGKRLMASVRDETIEQWLSLIDGKLKGETAERLRPELKRMTSADRSLLRRLVPRIVDTTLHHLLWTLEGNEDITVSVTADGENCPNIASESDGLAGEVYGPAGWIARFSKFEKER